MYKMVEGKVLLKYVQKSHDWKAESWFQESWRGWSQSATGVQRSRDHFQPRDEGLHGGDGSQALKDEWDLAWKYGRQGRLIRQKGWKRTINNLPGKG